MPIVVQKSEEDEYLSYCDDSCIEGDNCVCKTDHGMVNSGTSMFNHGISTCVLCTRKSLSKIYRVLNYNYPLYSLYDNHYVKYSKSDYKVDNGRIIQFCNFKPKEVDWFSQIFNTSCCLESVDWCLMVCSNNNCKNDVLSHVNKHRTLGAKNAYFDVSNNCVKCIKCDTPIKTLENENDRVIYKDNIYTRCCFCKTIIITDDSLAFHSCGECMKLVNNRINETLTSCFVCKNTLLTSSKKVLSQRIIVGRTKKRCIYLCRFHRFNINTEYISEEELEGILSSNIYRE